MERPEVPTEHLHEEIQHHAHSGQRWTLGVALSSALLAGLAAVASMKAGHYANEAMMAEIECSDQWNYYQSKSIKEAQLKSKVELLGALGKPATEADMSKITDYATEKVKIQKTAEGLGHEAKHSLLRHEVLARSVTMFQIAIAIGAISVLVRRRLFWFVSMGFGVVGVLFGVQSFLPPGSH